MPSIAQRRPSRTGRQLPSCHVPVTGPDALRSTKAGPDGPATLGLDQRPDRGVVERSTKAGPDGPATLAYCDRLDMIMRRSTKAGPDGPATQGFSNVE